MTRFAPLDIDDGAEAATKGTSASRVEASERTGVPFDIPARKKRQRLAFDRRQILHEIVDGLQTILECVLKYLIQPLLALASEQRDSERERLLHLGRQLGKHRNTAADVKAANGNLDARVAQFPGY